MQNKKEKRSPLRELPLHNPGESVERQIDDTVDKAMEYAAQVAGITAMMGIIWVQYLFKKPFDPFQFSVVGAIFIVYFLYRVFRLRDKISQLKLGRDGEKIVGQSIELLRENGYSIFHDIEAKDFNLDHVIVSKHGIFVIETKTYSKPVKDEAKILYDGEKILVNGLEPDRDPIKQAKANAAWLKDILKLSTGNTYPVKGIVVFPGWFVESKNTKSEVWVLNPKGIPTFIGNEPDVITQNDVHMIAYHLSRYIRSPLAK